MLQDQVIPINFGQGVDTKSDPKLVVPGKMLRLQDAVFTSPKQARKRNGYQQITRNILGGGTLAGPKMLKAFGNELVCADSGSLYSYSYTQAAWVAKGTYIPCKVTREVVARGYAVGSGNTRTTSAVSGSIALFAWTAKSTAYAKVIDLATGMTLIADIALSTSGSSSGQCVTMAGSTLAVFYLNASSKVCFRTVTLSAGAASLSAEIVLANSGTVNQVAGTAAGAVLSYDSTNTVTINTSGTITHTVAVTGYPVYEASTGRIWLYYTTPSGGNTLFYYRVYDSTLSVVLSQTLITTIATGSNAFAICGAASPSSGTQTLVYLSYASGPNWGKVYSVQVQSNGTVGTPTLLATNCYPFSEPFVMNGNSFVACNFFYGQNSPQSTIFVVNLADGSVCAKALAGVANDGFRSNAILSKPAAYGADKIILGAGETYDTYSGNGNRYALLGSSYVQLDFGSSELYQAVSADDNLLLNGGIVYSYDSQSVTELGFHLYPEVETITPGGAGTGNMSDGVYSYYVTYRWTDAKGNVYESAPSIGKQATVSTGGLNTGSVALTIKTLGITQKRGTRNNVEIRVYRTAANGTLAFETLEDTGPPPTPKLNDPTAVNVVFTDTFSTVSGDVPLYTAGGVLESIPPPPAVAMCVHKNRVWLIDSEYPNQLWYTKSLVPGAGVNFSDLLTVQVDAVGGKCVAVAPMDEKLVILEERLPLVMVGDGANDTGQGSTLSNPQPIPADAGCTTSKGVASFPMGVLFKTAKGIYLLDRALTVKYWGMDVEAYNSQDIVASTIISDRSQIRFLTSSGLTLVYDYIFNQWSTFTNHAGYSADVWQGSYVYARTDGKIYQEVAGYFLDDAATIAPLAQTSWLALGSVQGFQRVRRFAMLGDYVNGASANHGVQVSVAYDFNSSFSSPITYKFGTASSSGVFQYRERLPRQKCDSISLIIQEVPTGDSAEYVDFTDMSFEAGVKKGVNKLRAGATTG